MKHALHIEWISGRSILELEEGETVIGSGEKRNSFSDSIWVLISTPLVADEESEEEDDREV